MTVNRSRFHAFNRPRMWIAVFISGILWLGQLFLASETYQTDEFDEDVRLRYLDRAILLLESGEKGNPFDDWWTGRTDLESELDELESLIPDVDYQWDSWAGEYGMSALRNFIASHRGSPTEPAHWPEDWPRSEVRTDLLTEEYPAFIAQLYLSEEEDPDIRKLYDQQAATLFHRSLYVGGLRIFFLLGPLLFFAHAFSRKAQKEKKLPRFPSLWSPPLLLTVFFVGGILASLFFNQLSIFIIFLPEDIYWPWTLADFLWRAFPTFFMSLLLFQSPRAMWRSFGLDRPVAWRCLLFALGFTVLIDYLQYYAGGSGEVDPEDYFFFTDPDAFDLFDDLLSGVIAAPIFEEIIFRGFLFLGLQKRIGVGWAALISSVLFGIVHIQYDFWGIFGVTIFGFVCTWLAWRTQSIKTGIIFHMIYNLLITIDIYLIFQKPL